MRRRFHTADVFTNRLFGGNPVAVPPDGSEMGRPSRLFLEVEKQGGAARVVRVAGEAVLVSAGEMEIPDAP